MNKKQQETLVSYASRIDSARVELRKSTEEFVNKAFEMQEEWKVPACLIDCIMAEDGAAPDDEVVGLKRGTFYMTPMAVRRETGALGLHRYFVDGTVWYNGDSEYMEGIEVYDCGIIFNFLSWYVYHFADYLDDLKRRISSCTRIGDIGIVVEEWCDEYCYDFDCIDIEEIMAWSNEWINENR